MAEGVKENKSTEESVKLFVGQVPKHMTEPQLLAMFKEFALVDEVNIIKDKTTRASRGSFFLFISFFTFSESLFFFLLSSFLSFSDFFFLIRAVFFRLVRDRGAFNPNFVGVCMCV